MNRRPTVAISMGDPYGIGPEILALALARPALLRRARWLVFGDRSVLEKAAALRHVKVPASVEVVSLSALAAATLLPQGEASGAPAVKDTLPLAHGGREGVLSNGAPLTLLPQGEASGEGREGVFSNDLEPPHRSRALFRFGKPGPKAERDAGRHAIAYLEAAVDAVRSGQADALCTAPIHKGLMAKAGFAYAGHTDYLRDRFEVPRVVMMLAGPRLRVALATVHVPLVDVARNLSRAGLVETLAIVHTALRRDFRIPRPRIAVTGLNPHAGEDGLLGTEEQRIIAPAIAQARRRRVDARGPFPADSLFARQLRKQEFDVILAMSHDQGLGPLKAVDFDRAVNVTLGLPRPRTSPDHGVAFDIAGKGIADPTSMIEALELAAKLASS